MGQRLIRVGRVGDAAAPIAPGRGRILTKHLARIVGLLHQHADLIRRVDVVARRATRRDVDIQQGDLIVAKHRHVKCRLFHRHGRPFFLPDRWLRQHERADGQ